MLLKTAVDFSTLNIANLKATCLEDKMLYANKVDKLEMAHLFEEAIDNLLTQLEENAANEMLFLINKSCIEIISAPNTWKIIDTKERETTYAQHEAIQLINASPTAIAALYTICVYWLNEFLEYDLLNDFPRQRKEPNDQIKRLYLVRSN